MTTKHLLFKIFVFCCIAFLSLTNLGLSQNMDASLLRYGDNGNGKLTTKSITSRVLGLAYLENEAFPDLFIQTSSSLISQYPYVEHDGVYPVFGDEIVYNLPETLTAENTTLSLWQDSDGDLLLLGSHDKELFLYSVNVQENSFNVRHTGKLPQGITAVLSLQFWKEDNRLCIVASVPYSEHIRPPEDPYSKDFYAYDGAGIYRGNLNKVGLYYFEYPSGLENENIVCEPFTPSKEEVYLNFMSTSWLKNYEGNNCRLLTGSWYGAISYYDYEKNINSLVKRKYIYNQKGNPIRHPSQEASPIVYPNKVGHYQDIIAAGLGGLYYYRSIEGVENDLMIYEDPTPVLQKNTNVSTAAYATPTVYDWDGDGVFDIISGNAQGFIEFFKNTGTNMHPEFLRGENLKAGRQTIHIQPGYAESNYGPEYARNGFTGVNVIDWNKDGYPDVIINDGRGRHMVYLGVPEVDGVKLRKGYPLYLKGLELRGTWRCRPGVGLLGDKMAYVTLDDDDELHLYWYMDEYNITDGGKLNLRNFQKISGNAFHSLGTGRLKIELADWDGDGKVDLIIGASHNASIPNPTSGIPYNREDGVKSSAVVFLRNVNTNENPIYDLPVEIVYDGNYINFGIEECSPIVTHLGAELNDLPNLLIGSPDGRFYLLKRDKLSYK